MNLSDLQRKDIVNVLNGKRLGKIVDAFFNEQGSIEYFVVMERKFWHFFKAANDFNITFMQIKKIGEDVILVEI